MSDDKLPIQPRGDLRYNEGDALFIPFEFVEQFDDEYEPWEEPDDPHPIDLTDAQNIEFFVKEDIVDPDSEAVLTKRMVDDTGTETGEIDLTEPANGRCRVIIDTGDTDGMLTETVDGVEERLEEKTYEWVIRVTDADGYRVSSETGTWTIHAS